MKIRIKFIPDNGPTEVLDAGSVEDAIHWLFEREKMPEGMVLSPVPVALSTEKDERTWLQKFLSL